MSTSRDYLDHVSDLLAPFGPVTLRRMFSSVGVFRSGTMFALVNGETLYLRVDDRNRPDFEAAGMGQFIAYGKGRPVRLPYWEVPPDLLEDPDELAVWARRAWDAASRARGSAGRPSVPD